MSDELLHLLQAPLQFHLKNDSVDLVELLGPRVEAKTASKKKKRVTFISFGDVGIFDGV